MRRFFEYNFELLKLDVAPTLFTWDDVSFALPNPIVKAPGPGPLFADITGDSGDNTLTGTEFADTIDGLGGNDTIFGLGGDDTIIGNSGNDIMDGGAGDDTLSYASATGFISVDLRLTTQQNTNGSGLDTISNFENIIGSDFGNRLRLAEYSDGTLQGGLGNDALFGYSGAFTLLGGAGNDTFVLRTGESIAGSVLDGGTGTNSMWFEAHSSGSSSVDLRTGTLVNIENLLFSYWNAPGSAHIFVDAYGSQMENLALMTRSGYGSTDAATLTIHMDVGTLDLSNVFVSNSDNVIIEIIGNATSDVIAGTKGFNIINGNDGADTLIGGEGVDILNGGAGFDTVDYRGAASLVRFNVETGGTLGEADDDTYSSIERYYLSGFNDIVTGSDANEFFYGEDGDDIINGGGGIDRIYGGDGDDVQRGQDGNDVVYGSAGADQLNGGAGFDIANYSLAVSGVFLNLATGGTLGDAAGDTYFGIEAVYGSDFGDTLQGNSSSNELRGGEGDDIIEGGGGNDRLFGGEGADALFGDAGVDIVSYTAADSGIILDLILGGSSGEAAGDSFDSIEWVWGSDFDDSLTGDAANNRLEGRDGNDTLNGEGGNDRLLGGDGNDSINGGDGIDTIFGQNGDDIMTGGGGNDFFFGGDGADSHDGGTGTDTVSYLASSSGVTVNMQSFGTASTGDAAGDSFTSIERIFGSGFNDNLLGNTDDNVLLGNGGNDYLAGGSGNDSLNGGAGVDSFGYDEVVDEADVIAGFTLNEVIYIFGGTVTDFAALQALGSDAAANVVFDFGGGNTLTIVGHNLADLDASNFDFSGTPLAAEPLIDPDAFAADVADIFDMDALI